MPVEAACPSCDGKFRLPDAAAGKKIRCPKCKAPMEVPPLAAVPEPEPAKPDPPVPSTTPAATVEASCSHCAGKFRLPETAAGKKIRCPKCKEPMAVPALAEKPKSAPAEGLKSTWRASAAATNTTSPAPPVEKAPVSISPPAATFSAAPAAATPLRKKVADQVGELWFFRDEQGETSGPLERKTLDAWKQEGRVTADCQVLRHGSDQWQWASDLYADLEDNEEVADEQEAADSVVPPTNQHAPATNGSAEIDRDDETLSPHSKPVAFLLALTLGWLGIHRFYLGYVGLGLAMLFTCGGLFVWAIVDALRILFGKVTDSEGLKLRD
jgi:DNA-directed RNA polymerase subunit RPC12/RpoP